MNVFVVDTNVAVVANGGNENIDFKCQLSCVEKLQEVVERETVAVDERGLIIEEYRNHLSLSGKPGVGDMFFKYLWDNQHLPNGRVRRVVITPSEDDRRSFEELPRNNFDPSDRKFLAVAVKANAVVLNATDSDWRQQDSLMKRLCLKISQLCPHYASK